MSRIVDIAEIINQISGVVYAPKQQNPPYLDLTVKQIYRVKSAGALDFGGSEFQETPREAIFPVKKHPEDEYGWWSLHEGYILLEYNESFSLRENQVAFLEPHPHLLQSGCFHPTLSVRELNASVRIPLWVPKMGLHLKQNARISRMLIIEIT